MEIETKQNSAHDAEKRELFSERVTKWIGSVPSLIIHTLFFLLSLALIAFGYNTSNVLLVLTTVVSLEAIYLSIFIQMSVNRQAESLEDVEEDIDEIQEDVDEISKDIDEIQEDVDEIQEDVDEISKDIDEIQEDVDEIQEDVDEIQEHDEKTNKVSLDNIESMLRKAIDDLERLKSQLK